MEPTTLLILGSATAAALSLLENSRPAGAFDQKQPIPGNAMAILRTIDVTQNRTGNNSLVYIAEYIWQHYNLEQLQWDQPPGAIRRGTMDMVLDSHSYFAPFKQAFELETKLKKPLAAPNMIALDSAISGIIADIPHAKLHKVRTAASFMLQNMEFTFRKIIFYEDERPPDIDYSLRWKTGVTVDMGATLDPLSLEDYVIAFFALAQAGDESDVIVYSLYAERLYNDFFFLFVGWDDSEWEKNFKNRGINFPRFPKVTPYYIEGNYPRCGGPGAPCWSRTYSHHNTQTEMSLDDAAIHMVRYFRPFSKCPFTQWSPNTPNHFPFSFQWDQLQWALDSEEWLQPYKGITFPMWPLTQEYLEIMMKLWPESKFEVFMFNYEFGTSFSHTNGITPIKNYKYDPRKEYENSEEKNEQIALSKFFNWYFTNDN